MPEPTSVVSTMTLVMQSVDVSSTAHVMNAMDVLGQVHAFYSDAWSNLMWFLGISVTILGLGVPFLIYFFQNKSAKSIEQSLKCQIANQKIEFDKQLSDQKTKFNDELQEIKNRHAQTESLVWINEGVNCKEKGDIETSLTAFVCAIIELKQLKDVSGIIYVLLTIKSMIDENLVNSLEKLKLVDEILQELNGFEVDNQRIKDYISYIKKFYETKKDAEV